MTPDVVVDIGNSRMKWGRCLPTVEDGGWVSLPLDDLNAWDDRLEAWGIDATARWAVASVNPPVTETFKKWRRTKGGTCVVFERYSDLPIRVNLEAPETVGLDRLFGAVAAKGLVPPGTPAITVDVGTAVTVNLIDAGGVFQGGAIFPGPRLMARALHEHTAKLPLSEPTDGSADRGVPAKNTAAAIRAGILAALGGGMAQVASAFADECLDECRLAPWLFVTGGGAHLIGGYTLPWLAEMRLVPTLTLDGIRIAAETRP